MPTTKKTKNQLLELSEFIKINLAKIEFYFYYNNQPEYSKKINIGKVLAKFNFSKNIEIRIRFRDTSSEANFCNTIKPLLEDERENITEIYKNSINKLEIYLFADIYFQDKYVFTIDPCNDSTYKINTITKYEEIKRNTAIYQTNQICITKSLDERSKYGVIISK